MDLDAVADELYALWPADFTAARTEKEKEARAAGDKALAADIKKLGKPTTVAWLANRLVRQHGDELTPLLELGEALREASEVLEGAELRTLSQQQHQLVAALVRTARKDAAADGHRVGEDAARGLEETLRAALADASLADELATGRLTGALSHSGFGSGGGGAVAKPSPVKPEKAKPEPKPDKKALAEARAAVTSAQQEADRASAAQTEAQAALDAASTELAELTDRVAELRRQLDEATADRAAADERRRAAQPVVAAAGKEVRRTERALRAATDRLEALR